MTYAQIVERLVDLALERFALRQEAGGARLTARGPGVRALPYCTRTLT